MRMLKLTDTMYINADTVTEVFEIAGVVYVRLQSGLSYPTAEDVETLVRKINVAMSD